MAQDRQWRTSANPSPTGSRSSPAPRAALARRWRCNSREAGAHVIAVARTVGGLEELDDKIKTAGGTATLVPLDMKDLDGIARLALALNERFGRLDVLVGNAGMLNTPSPLPHIEPKVWNDLIAVNVTANWQLIRTLDPAAQARGGRPRGVHDLRPFLSGAAVFRLYAVIQSRARDHGAHLRSRNSRRRMCAPILFSPGQTRTRMMATAFPGVDPETLPTPEDVAKAIVPLCLASCTENGRFYDFRAGKFLDFHPPA